MSGERGVSGERERGVSGEREIGGVSGERKRGCKWGEREGMSGAREGWV